MADITPMISGNKKIIQSYRGGEFKISGEIYKTPVLVFSDAVHEWNVPDDCTDLEISSFSQIIGADNIDVLLFGSGKKSYFLSLEIREFLKSSGVIVESMDTGAACRTYNVLIAEERNVALAMYTV